MGYNHLLSDQLAKLVSLRTTGIINQSDRSILGENVYFYIITHDIIQNSLLLHIKQRRIPDSLYSLLSCALGDSDWLELGPKHLVSVAGHYISLPYKLHNHSLLHEILASAYVPGQTIP